jgi:hypothetical protein
MSIPQAIREFRRIWKEMALTVPDYARIIPMYKAKRTNTSSFQWAFDEILLDHRQQLNQFFNAHLSNSDLPLEVDQNSFASDPTLCKT